MKVLIFDIYGDYGHFKKFYTTSSPLTFSFPPPPTVQGMLGAICGIDKSGYLEVFSRARCKIALGLRGPVKKVRMGINHINTKGNHWTPVKKKYHEARTQIRTEFLKDPAYRLYVHHRDELIFNTLLKNVREHKTVYSLSLGLSELLADFQYVDLSEVKEITGSGPVSLNSVLPVPAMEEYGMCIEEGKKYFKEKIPVEMTAGRVVENYEDVIFEARGQTMKAAVKKYWETEKGDKIVFF